MFNLLSNAFGKDKYSDQSRLIQIGNKILYFTSDEIMEYCLQTNKTRSIKYPNNIKISSHCCCLFPDNNMVYIIFGAWKNAQILRFDPNTYTFVEKEEKEIEDIVIPPLGSAPTCIGLYDKIHIFGYKNETRMHLIYCPKTNKIIKNISETYTDMILSGSIIINYENRLYRLGGYDHNLNKATDMFAVSNIIAKDKYDNIKWTIKEKQKLPNPMWSFGCILYKSFIITFGGKLNTKWDCIDDIFVLNISDDNQEWKPLKWKENIIKCPGESLYAAILINDEENKNKNELLVFGYIRESINSIYVIISKDIVNIVSEFYSFNDDIHICQRFIDRGREPLRYYSMYPSKSILSELN